jgi:endo-1,4-beta-D-glucanase Y
MLVAVGAIFFQLQATGGIPAILGGGVAGNAGRSLVGIRATFRTFQRNNETNAFSSHSFAPTKLRNKNTYRHKFQLFHMMADLCKFWTERNNG